MAISGLAVAVAAGLRKRKCWAIPATHILFAFATCFVLLQVLSLGFAANGNDAKAFVNPPSTFYGWVLWSVVNVEGVAANMTPMILSLLLAIWVPSCVSLKGHGIRAYFDLPASKVTGKPLLACACAAFCRSMVLRFPLLRSHRAHRFCACSPSVFLNGCLGRPADDPLRDSCWSRTLALPIRSCAQG